MSDSQNSIFPIPTVSLINDRPATTSFQIAECFGKNHKEVLRDIRALIDTCPTDFHQRNFALMSRKVKIGNGAERDDPYYVVFFDGFILLVMGYTGQKALKMKLAYIGAFNAMRAKPENRAPVINGDAPITPSDQNLVQTLVKAVADKYPQEQRKRIFMQVWMRLRNHFRVGSYKQLLQKQMPEAVLYLANFQVSKPSRAKTELPKPNTPRLGIAAPTNMPTDMTEGRRRALEAIARLSVLAHHTFSEITEYIRVGCHPGPRTMAMSQKERDISHLLEDLQNTAYDSLTAAYNAIEAGHKVSRLYNHR